MYNSFQILRVEFIEIRKYQNVTNILSKQHVFNQE